MAVYGQILDGEGTLGHETHHFGLQGPRSCGCGGGNLRVARLGGAEINSVLCNYMRVMLRGRAKTVENGRVRQWPNQRLHEHKRIPSVQRRAGGEWRTV